VNENIWSVNGEKDSTVMANRATIAGIRAAGGNPIYTELEGHGHDSWRTLYPSDAFMTWMYAQRRGVPWWNVSEVPTLAEPLTPGQVVVSGPSEPTGGAGGSGPSSGGAGAGGSGGAVTGGSAMGPSAGGSAGSGGGHASAGAAAGGLFSAGAGGNSGSGTSSIAGSPVAESPALPPVSGDSDSNCSLRSPLGRTDGAWPALLLALSLAGRRATKRPEQKGSACR
jgi:hypothetical protein